MIIEQLMSARHMNLSWSFIQHWLRQYGFSELVSNRIMHRITSVSSYKVVVNGIVRWTLSAHSIIVQTKRQIIFSRSTASLLALCGN